MSTLGVALGWRSRAPGDPVASADLGGSERADQCGELQGDQLQEGRSRFRAVVPTRKPQGPVRAAVVINAGHAARLSTYLQLPVFRTGVGRRRSGISVVDLSSRSFANRWPPGPPLSICLLGTIPVIAHVPSPSLFSAMPKPPQRSGKVRQHQDGHQRVSDRQNQRTKFQIARCDESPASSQRRSLTKLNWNNT
jgi:hypothetical protein